MRGLERVALREKEARRALYSDLQRDVLLQRKSDSVRRLEEERRSASHDPEAPGAQAPHLLGCPAVLLKCIA